MTLPSTDLLYLREDERTVYDATLFHPEGSNPYWDAAKLFFARLVEARKEIARLQIASGEVMPQSIGDEVV